jgi:hypothetical protein
MDRNATNFLYKWDPECLHAPEKKKKRISFITVKM